MVRINEVVSLYLGIGDWGGGRGSIHNMATNIKVLKQFLNYGGEAPSYFGFCEMSHFSFYLCKLSLTINNPMTCYLIIPTHDQRLLAPL